MRIWVFQIEIDSAEYFKILLAEGTALNWTLLFPNILKMGFSNNLFGSDQILNTQAWKSFSNYELANRSNQADLSRVFPSWSVSIRAEPIRVDPSQFELIRVDSSQFESIWQDLSQFKPI